ncbi:hypothetical protein [Bacillus sp. 2205SS5-2]|uniref:hypothetical protein n=1 Tax=Bacillus sp. 2205SS5-2 TaxID=3109031 RepID=UPI003005D81C
MKKLNKMIVKKYNGETLNEYVSYNEYEEKDIEGVLEAEGADYLTLDVEYHKG